MKLFNERMEDALRNLEDNSVDSIVTDPPYHLLTAGGGGNDAYGRVASKGFMGKEWDGGDVAFRPETWEECLRVLKPGGHLIAFSGARTYHRMACAIEDAGFEIRDQIMWVYGSGFPKSHNIGKALEKKLNKALAVFNDSEFGKVHAKTSVEESIGTPGSSWIEQDVNGNIRYQQADENYNNMGRNNGACPKCGKPNSYGQIPGGKCPDEECYVRAALRYTPDNEWAGWGTALKPAHEPMVLARKPLANKVGKSGQELKSRLSVVDNVEKYGVGALNIDASKIPLQEGEEVVYHSVGETGNFAGREGKVTESEKDYHTRNEGRWPANFIHDGSDEVVEQFPITESGKASKTPKVYESPAGQTNVYHWSEQDTTTTHHNPDGTPKLYGDKGSAARFFYIPKVSKKERNEGLEALPDQEWKDVGACIPERNNRPFNPVKNTHPTVKPIDLMRHLIVLVTPPGGTVLDPFMGSGSTGCAAVSNGFDFVGVEMEEDSYNVAKARIEYWSEREVT